MLYAREPVEAPPLPAARYVPGLGGRLSAETHGDGPPAPGHSRPWVDVTDGSVRLVERGGGAPAPAPGQRPRAASVSSLGSRGTAATGGRGSSLNAHPLRRSSKASATEDLIEVTRARANNLFVGARSTRSRSAGIDAEHLVADAATRLYQRGQEALRRAEETRARAARPPPQWSALTPTTPLSRRLQEKGIPYIAGGTSGGGAAAASAALLSRFDALHAHASRAREKREELERKLAAA
jgi:hypothetical protein